MAVFVIAFSYCANVQSSLAFFQQSGQIMEQHSQDILLKLGRYNEQVYLK